ncbi:MAG TPA: tryptophan-rich sensory protein [Bacteroidales bacterium]|nr:tryptophan-rich sensory protein [Bacteroidales bacterium]
MIKYINLLLFAGMIVMNYLANALPLNNRTTGELSDAYPNLFVPAGLTFSIWGIIYLLLLGYCIVQFRSSNQIAVSGTSVLFAVTCILNAAWIFAWHYQKLPLSLIIMIGLLASLIMINVFLEKVPMGLIKAAFGIYLGWICIATIANVTALLVNYNWDGFGISEETWTIIMIAAGAVITSLSILNTKNPFIGLSVVWAFTGIIIKRQEDYRSIVIAAAIAIVVVTAITVLGFARKPTA